mgnify:CR=1 FL=1
MRRGQMLTLRLPPPDIDRLTAAAEERGVSRSELMRRALVEAIPDVEWSFDEDQDIAKEDDPA